MIATLSLSLLFWQIPSAYHLVYEGVLYPVIRYCLDSIFCLLPFASIYILIPLAMLMIINNIMRYYVQKKQQKGRRNSRKKIMAVILRGTYFCFKTATIVICLFYILWGFHYVAPSPVLKLNISVSEISKSDLEHELELTKTALVDISNTKKSFNNLNINALKAETFSFCRDNLNPRLWCHRDKAVWIPVRQIYPKGWLSGFGASGIYNPFTGECNIDAGLHYLQKPYTIAHELTHACGITDEGFCNFVAYQVCCNSSIIDHQYSGHLMYWRTVAAAYKTLDPERYKVLRASLPPNIISDLDEINANIRSMPNFISSHAEIYDAFLKSQGQQAGIQSYDKVIGLVRAYRGK